MPARADLLLSSPTISYYSTHPIHSLISSITFNYFLLGYYTTFVSLYMTVITLILAWLFLHHSTTFLDHSFEIVISGSYTFSSNWLAFTLSCHLLNNRLYAPNFYSHIWMSSFFLRKLGSLLHTHVSTHLREAVFTSSVALKISIHIYSVPLAYDEISSPFEGKKTIMEVVIW